MTAAAKFPGAKAVVLHREEFIEDQTGTLLHYERIKVFSAAGDDVSNLALNIRRKDDLKEITDFAARTIHADGKIIPFVGKLRHQVLEKHGSVFREQSLATLPGVEPGSVLEYVYRTHYERFAEPPVWLLQSDLPVLEELLVWAPAFRAVDESHRPLEAVSWLPRLPPGVVVEQNPKSVQGFLIKSGDFAGLQTYVVRANDLPPLASEAFMSPLDSIGYEVRFEYTLQTGAGKYWSDAGNEWSKKVNSFAATDKVLADTARKLVENASGEEEKARRLYAAVQALENTDYRRARNPDERRKTGVVDARHAVDVWKSQSGSSNELANLFLAMTRTVGLQTFAAVVVDGRNDVFEPKWMNIAPLTDEIVLLHIGERDLSLDPGTPFVAFGSLAQEHESVGGLRQMAKGTAFISTGAGDAMLNRSTRIESITLSADGHIKGKLEWTFRGALAQEWRIRALKEDAEGLEESARKELRPGLPEWLDINWQRCVREGKTAGDPFTISVNIEGVVPRSGRRWLLPANLFTARSVNLFRSPDRLTPVHLPFPESVVDIVQVQMPRGLEVTAVPESLYVSKENVGSYNFFLKQDASGFNSQRRLVLEKSDIPLSRYPDLHELFLKAQAVDRSVLAIEAK